VEYESVNLINFGWEYGANRLVKFTSFYIITVSDLKLNPIDWKITEVQHSDKT